MPTKQISKDQPKEKPSRTDQAREVVQEYADDQRAIIEKLRKALS